MKNSLHCISCRVSFAIQKGNAVCVSGGPNKTSPGLEGLFNFHVQEVGMMFLLIDICENIYYICLYKNWERLVKVLRIEIRFLLI